MTDIVGSAVPVSKLPLANCASLVYLPMSLLTQMTCNGQSASVPRRVFGFASPAVEAYAAQTLTTKRMIYDPHPQDAGVKNTHLPSFTEFGSGETSMVIRTAM